MSKADDIRDHVLKRYAEPARRAGSKGFAVRTGDVHRALGLSNAMPNVCSAIESGKFAAAAGVRLAQRTGPRAGANVRLVFEFDARDPGPALVASAEEEEFEGDEEEASTADERAIPTDVDFTDAVALVSCVKSKRSIPMPARDLYCSPLFTGARAVVEASGVPWFILSARHGLVHPMEVIAPYEQTLNRMGVAERKAWSSIVLEQLHQELHGHRHVVFFAGLRYREFLVDPLRAHGYEVVVPMQGLSQGRQLQWLLRQR